MKIQQSKLDDIKTPEEAKQQISLLLESQKNAHYFLYIFCNYSIKELLLIIKGYTELMQKEEFADEHPSFLETLAGAEKRMLELINTIGFLALDERNKFESPQENPHNFPPETVNLKPFLDKAKSQIQEFADHENAKPYRSLQTDEKHDHTLRKQAPLQTHFNVPDDLPIVKFNDTIEGVISEAIHFVTQHGTIAELFIHAVFDEETVKIIFSCSTSTPHTHILEDFKRFETAYTIFEFDPQILFLYQSWLNLKIYDGELLLEIQDGTANQQLSIASATICLKR